jgi:cobalt/nickel transport system permease protein
MRAGLAARGYAPRHALQAATLGRVVTAMFLRTYERAERVHLAMLARGFDGQMPRLGTLALRPADALFLAGLVPVLAVRFVA